MSLNGVIWSFGFMACTWAAPRWNTPSKVLTKSSFISRPCSDAAPSTAALPLAQRSLMPVPFLTAWVRGGSVGRRSAKQHLLSRRRQRLLAIQGGGIDDTESGEESGDEAEEEDGDSKEEEDDNNNDDIVSWSKNVKPLMLEESRLDKDLRVAQSAGQVIGAVHDTLSKKGPIGFLLSNGLFARLGGFLFLILTTKKLDENVVKNSHKLLALCLMVFWMLSMELTQLSYHLIRHAIAKENDQTEVRVSSRRVTPSRFFLFFCTPVSELTRAGDSDFRMRARVPSRTTLETATVRDYDLELAEEAAVRAVKLPLTATFFLRFRRDWLRGILFMIFAPLAQCVTDQLFQIYILGCPAEGALSRPFKSPEQQILEDIGAVKDQGADEGDKGASEAGVDVSELEVPDNEEEEGAGADDDDDDDKVPAAEEGGD